MSVAEQRYKAVMAVVGDGRSVTEVAASWGVSRQTLHTWLARYESGGLENLVDRSHRPASCPHKVDPDVEVAIWEMRRAHPGWGPTRLVFELGRRRGGLPLGGLPGAAPSRPDRPRGPSTPRGALAPLGAGPGDGVGHEED